MPNENAPVTPAAAKFSVDMIPVESSNIASVGWVNNMLFVEFLNGGQYRYSNVPSGVFQGMMAAESKGHYLASLIKGKYAYAKVVIVNTHQAEEE